MKINKNQKLKSYYEKLPRLLLALPLAMLLGLMSLLTSYTPAFAASDTQLYISPSSQSVASGSNISFTVVVNPGTNSINTVQTVLTFNSTNFRYVSVTAGSDFTTFIPSSSGNAISFSAANSTSPITSTQTVATITLSAIGGGSSGVTLASVCPSGDYASTCSATYDSVTSNNDLQTVSGSTITVTESSGGGGGGSGGGGTSSSSSSGSSSKSTTTTTTTTKTTPSKTTNPTSSPSTTTQPAPANSAPTPANPANPSYSLLIKVLNSSGEPVSGASVSLYSKTVKTNAQGIAIFSLVPGSYKISVKGPGIKLYSNQITVASTPGDQQLTVKTKTAPTNYLDTLIVAILVIIAIGVFYVWLKKKRQFDNPLASVDKSEVVIGSGLPGKDIQPSTAEPKQANVDTKQITPSPPVVSPANSDHPPLAIHSEQNPINSIPVQTISPKAAPVDPVQKQSPISQGPAPTQTVISGEKVIQPSKKTPVLTPRTTRP